MSGDISVRVDDRELLRLIGDMPEARAAFLDQEAEAVKNYVVQSFGTSPSSPGEPPGVDTGNLRASINWSADGPGRRIVSDGTEEGYGLDLEFGTSNEDGSTRMAPRPFMRPAFDWLRRNIRDHARRFNWMRNR